MQPGYPQQPNPYQQQGFQQPNPYAQPGGPQPGPAGPPSGQWTGPGAPGGPQPPGDGRNKRTTVIAISAAVAVVIAAGVTGAVVLTGGDGKDDQKATEAKESAKPSVSAPASSSPGGGGEDNPRASTDIKPVISGWKVVQNPKRHVVFDVPPEWGVASTGTGVIVPDDTGKDKDGMAEAMSSPAYFQETRCTRTNDKGIKLNHEAGITGAKGAQGAKNLEEAAENAAASWAWAMFDQKKQGHLNIGKPSAFKSDHGITGFTAMTTATDVPKSHKCATDGKAYSVAYKDDTGDLNTWIFAGIKDEKDEVPEDTIKKIMSTLRPLKSS
ncbi:hypothetical protein [Streptomyces griseocarneus]|uniref:hypothetical protein n=1 Tax=Streptomyces griseocarneus TaxID=51201 RepID=UPI0027DF67A3|nr:hypothetical protein [Streptomyces griseocarneus]